MMASLCSDLDTNEANVRDVYVRHHRDIEARKQKMMDQILERGQSFLEKVEELKYSHERHRKLLSDVEITMTMTIAITPSLPS